MVSKSLAPVEPVVPGRIREFYPAVAESMPLVEIADTDIDVVFEVRAIGGADVQRLDGDPNRELPIPVLRLSAHVMATFVLVMAAGLAMAAVAPRLLGFGSVVVTSGSMEPAIRAADVVITAPSDGVGLGRGAVIDFETGDGTRLHRITDVIDGGYRTAGDANLVEDSDPVVPSQIRGVGIVVVPLIGLPRTWIDEGRWLAVLALVVLLVCALHMSRTAWIDGATDPLVTGGNGARPRP